MTRENRILVVDDNPTNLKLALALLANEPWTVRTATDAQQALAVLEWFSPSVILLDLQLPDMDGLTLARRLKSDARTRDIPLVALTAYAMRGDEEKALDAGFDAYLTKPIDKAAFRRVLHQYLEPSSM